MSYTPINWQTGDTITAEKMNKMDNGWGVSSAQLFNETVTTTVDEDGFFSGFLAYHNFISADVIQVTFNGTAYTCEKSEPSTGVCVYGGVEATGPDFTKYPFALLSNESGINMIYTETAGTYAISAFSLTIETSDIFALAAKSASQEVFIATVNVTTWQEIYDAFNSGKIVNLLRITATPLGNREAYSAPVLTATYDGSSYNVSVVYIDNGNLVITSFTADSADSPIQDGK